VFILKNRSASSITYPLFFHLPPPKPRFQVDYSHRMAYSNNIGHSAVNGTSETATGHNGDTSGSAPSGQASNGSRSVLEVTGDHARILKVLDHLRRLGLDQGPNAHSLPQIVVCGGQSSGKSSVLEAIAGIPFPRKSKLCTRYRTRVTLLRKPASKVVLKIIPENGRPSD
jgi:Dynamin family